MIDTSEVRFLAPSSSKLNALKAAKAPPSIALAAPAELIANHSQESIISSEEADSPEKTASDLAAAPAAASHLGVDLFGAPVAAEKQGSRLAESWDYPPFSVLNAREGWWQERKRQWLALGIKSEVGRDIDPTCISKNAPEYMAGRGNDEGGSVFDPVLCELPYRWFSPPGGIVLDPFAGGSVRGIVASHLGRAYYGVELRPEQVAANRDQVGIAGPVAPRWIEGDSRNISTMGLPPADMVFSCPPYADLERYSEDPRDLSTMDYPAFLESYRVVIAAACEVLKNDRFACFVVGEVRDKRGNYRNFVGDTVEAFRAAGLHYYNEAILVTAVGSLPVRAGRQFSAGRKLGKTHQNVLVFVKGDGKRAAAACSL